MVRSRKYMQGIKITSLLIVSNIALIVYNVCAAKYFFEGSQSMNLAWVIGITWFVYAGLQNVSHWMFSYEYYNMVR